MAIVYEALTSSGRKEIGNTQIKNPTLAAVPCASNGRDTHLPEGRCRWSGLVTMRAARRWGVWIGEEENTQNPSTVCRTLVAVPFVPPGGLDTLTPAGYLQPVPAGPDVGRPALGE
jgi:hypothetical protein